MQNVLVKQQPIFRPFQGHVPRCMRVVKAGLFDFFGDSGASKGRRSAELVKELLSSSGLSLAPSPQAKEEVKDLVQPFPGDPEEDGN